MNMLDFSSITLKKIDENGDKAVFEVGPLPKGYGFTLGNALRRVMLSSLKGTAISSVRINNLTHEFTTLPGVKQNVLDLVLKLKNVKVRMDDDAAVAITLTAKGVGKIKAGDLKVPKGVEIVNKKYVIAEITEKSAELSLEAIVEKGIGYKKADESLRDEIGRIPVDTLFSPVTLVDFTVAPTRKGDQADLDKLVITVTTDGSVTPEEALAEAGGILKNLMTQLTIVFGTQEEEVVEEVVEEMEDWKLAEIGLSDRIMKKLSASGIETLSQASEKTEEYFLKVAKLTANQFAKVVELLTQYNLEVAKDA